MCAFYLDKFWQWLANNIVSRRLIYWVFIRGAAIATTGQYRDTNPSELDVMIAIQRLDAN
jgi:hypothetical protein